VIYLDHLDHKGTLMSSTNWSPTIGVYALVDPRTDRVMYVGQSIDIDFRYRQHLHSSPWEGNRRKVDWISELRSLGLEPRLVILEECNFASIDEAERRHIRRFKSEGQCEFNVAAGGKGSGVSRIQNGHPDDWYQVGRKIKAARGLLLEIGDDIYRLSGPKYFDSFRKVVSTLDRFKIQLEGLLIERYPNLLNLSKLLWGPDREVED
jgi:hypothetical protein